MPVDSPAKVSFFIQTPLLLFPDSVHLTSSFKRQHKVTYQSDCDNTCIYKWS